MFYFEANSILSEKGKKASEAKIEFSVKYDLAFSIAKLTLFIRLGCPDPIPIMDFLEVIIIALDFTNLVQAHANAQFSISFLLGLFFVTKSQFLIKSFLLSIS